MDPILFREIERRALEDKEGAEIAEWARGLSPCQGAEQFRDEAIWVILCSGISYRAARTMHRWYHETGGCNHPNKAKAIAKWEAHYYGWWIQFSHAKTEMEKLHFLGSLPFMGGKALRFQLAKNLGLTGYCKPDVHLRHVAAFFRTDPQTLCERLAAATGLTVAYIDTVLWFGCMKGFAYQLIGESV